MSKRRSLIDYFPHRKSRRYAAPSTSSAIDESTGHRPMTRGRVTSNQTEYAESFPASVYDRPCTASFTSTVFTTPGVVIDNDNNTFRLNIADLSYCDGIDPYYDLYELFKVKKVVMEYWLSDNDLVSKTDVNSIIEMSVYEPQYTPDSAIHLFDQVQGFPNHKTQLLVPGKVYVKSFEPVYDILQGASTNIGSGLGVPLKQNMWVRTAELDAESTLVSSNCYLVIWYKRYLQPKEISYRFRYEVEFKSKKL